MFRRRGEAIVAMCLKREEPDDKSKVTNEKMKFRFKIMEEAVPTAQQYPPEKDPHPILHEFHDQNEATEETPSRCKKALEEPFKEQLLVTSELPDALIPSQDGNISMTTDFSNQDVSNIPIYDISGLEPESEAEVPKTGEKASSAVLSVDAPTYSYSEPDKTELDKTIRRCLRDSESLTSQAGCSTVLESSEDESPLEVDDDPDFIPPSIASTSPSSLRSLSPVTGFRVVGEIASFSVDEEAHFSRNASTSLAVPTFRESDAQLLPSTQPAHPIEYPLTRKRKANPSEWKTELRKRLRASCLPYISKTGKPQEAKVPKTVSCNKCYFKCSSKFTEEQRTKLCKAYHVMDFKRQKDFLLSSVEVSEVERKSASKRGGKSGARKYFLTLGDKKERVCKQFFTKTLTISHGPIDTALRNKNEGSPVFNGDDRRGRKQPGNKTREDVKQFVLDHIDSFPTTEGHYCRKSTSRKYLDPTLSITKMYQLFKTVAMNDFERMMEEWMQEKGRKENRIENCEENQNEVAEKPTLKMVSEVTYRRIFCEERNLSFFKPKKDQCLRCTSYTKASSEEKENLEEEYRNHLERKAEANDAKDFDKKRANEEPHFVTATFDLQSVLQIPSSDVSAMYYSRKLNAFNLTVYEGAKPNNAYCYTWTEINGARGSIEIGTALMLWINGLPPHVRHVSLFSDTCGGQNRNQHMASLMLYLVNKLQHVETIEHKFLESGHTHMEADSMHSAIESAKKHVPVYTVQDWLTIMRMARSTRKNKLATPYIVSELNFSQFVDLKKLSSQLLKNRHIDSDGNKINWLKIKRFKFQKGIPTTIYFSYDYKGEYKELDVTWKKNGGRVIHALPTSLTHCYKKPIPISEAKKRDLLKLCCTGAIPSEYHKWYAEIPSLKNKVDRLPEPSVSDDDSD